MQSSAADKRMLRLEALARRREVEPHVRAQYSARLARFGLELAQRLRATAVSAFHPFRDEPDTLALIGALAEHGFVTLLPVAGPRATPLIFRQWRPGEPLGAGAFGVQEPPAEAPQRDPDLIFAPLACFDRRGHRIGYGAGHYDRTIAALREAGPLTIVGAAFACSEIPVLPDEPHDERLDYILTEHELIDCRTA